MYRAANRRWGGAALASGGASGAWSPLGGEIADLHPDGWKNASTANQSQIIGERIQYHGSPRCKPCPENKRRR
nr:MAG TPA_asm: hypothetical protein [Caudoviricetes sp.]